MAHIPKKTEYLHFSTTKLSLPTRTQCPPKNRDFTAPLLISRKEKKKLFWIALESRTFTNFFCRLTYGKGTLPSGSPLFLKGMPTSLTQSTNYEQQMCIFFQTTLFSIASHKKLYAMKLAVLKICTHSQLALVWEKSVHLFKTIALYMFLLCKFSFILSVVFQAEKIVPSSTFATGLQIAQLLVQAFWGWGIFLGLDSPLT